MDIENNLREMLLPVLGLSSIVEIKPEYALVRDLGADSIDFVEIIYHIEQNFGVVLKTNEIFSAGANAASMFNDGKLTRQGVELIRTNLKDSNGRYKEGMNKMELFSTLSVGDLAQIIQLKQSAAWEN
ncbi:MAG TPA: phosphopantetheine-binding protein [Candidatus Deferrimicrobium sp.]|nr:phosphopantetheine-binding protein [Candidatus Deferrimicrobium sp.]